MQANLGAKNHAIILPDADKQTTLNSIVGAAFGAAGQRCMALSVAIFVGDAKEWVHDLVAIASKLKVGPGMDPSTDIGPLVTADAKTRVEALITAGIAHGANCVLDGRNFKVSGFEKGNFVGPTILTNVSNTNPAYIEEIFGPVLVCMSVNSMEEGLQIINSNKYGNGCAVFTQSGVSARRFQRDVDVGQVS